MSGLVQCTSHPRRILSRHGKAKALFLRRTAGYPYLTVAARPTTVTRNSVPSTTYRLTCNHSPLLVVSWGLTVLTRQATPVRIVVTHKRNRVLSFFAASHGISRPTLLLSLDGKRNVTLTIYLQRAPTQQQHKQRTDLECVVNHSMARKGKPTISLPWTLDGQTKSNLDYLQRTRTRQQQRTDLERVLSHSMARKGNATVFLWTLDGQNKSNVDISATNVCCACALWQAANRRRTRCHPTTLVS